MRKLITIFISLGITGMAAGQTEDSTYRFSVKEAIEYALQNQHDVLNASLDADISQKKVSETRGIGLPQLNSSFGIRDYLEIPTVLVPGEFSGEPAGTFFPVKFGTQYQAELGVTLTQLLFDGTYLVGLNAAKTYTELAQKNLKRTRIETGAAVFKAYFNYLLVQERKNVVDANVERVKKLRDDTQALFNNGFVEKIDLDRVNLSYNNLLTEQDKFTRFQDVSLSLLKFQMGMNIHSTLILTDSLDVQRVKSMSSSVENANVESRIEYSILQTQVRLQEYNIKRFKTGYYPSLVGFANLSSTAYRDNFDITDPEKKWYPTGLIGVTLSLPLYDGSQKGARIKQEKMALQKIQNDLENFKNAADLEVDTYRASLVDALRALETQESNLHLAQEIVKTSKLKYDQGVGSNLEVMDAETSLKESQVNYFNAIFDAFIAKLNLEKSLGNLNY